MGSETKWRDLPLGIVQEALDLAAEHACVCLPEDRSECAACRLANELEKRLVDLAREAQ